MLRENWDLYSVWNDASERNLLASFFARKLFILSKTKRASLWRIKSFASKQWTYLSASVCSEWKSPGQRTWKKETTKKIPLVPEIKTYPERNFDDVTLFEVESITRECSLLAKVPRRGLRFAYKFAVPSSWLLSNFPISRHIVYGFIGFRLVRPADDQET